MENCLKWHITVVCGPNRPLRESWDSELSWESRGGLWANIHQRRRNWGLSADKHQPVDSGQADKDGASFRTSPDTSPAFISSCWKPKSFYRAGATQSEVGMKVNTQESLTWVLLKLCCSVVSFPSLPHCLNSETRTCGFHYRNNGKRISPFAFNTHSWIDMIHFSEKFFQKVNLQRINYCHLLLVVGVSDVQLQLMII